MHAREDSSSDLLVVAIFLDAREYGSNVEVSIEWYGRLLSRCKHHTSVALCLCTFKGAKTAEL